MRHDKCFESARCEWPLAIARLCPSSSASSTVGRVAAADSQTSGNLGNAHAIKLVASVPSVAASCPQRSGCHVDIAVEMKQSRCRRHRTNYHGTLSICLPFPAVCCPAPESLDSFA